MPNTPLEAISLRGWAAGVNLQADDATIQQDELSLCENISFGLNGELAKRKGYSEYTTSKHASMAAGHFLFYWNQLGSANDYFIYVDSDGDVHSETGTDFSTAADFDIGAATGVDDYPVAGATFENVFYLTSLRANPRSFNGTSWTEITDTTLDGTASAEFPKASFLAVKHERVFAANINNNGTRERSRIRWSRVGQADSWESTSWIDVDPDDGTEITGIVPFADGIVVFKEKAMFFLSGVDANTFTLFPIDSTIGTQSPGSIAVTESDVFFLDNTKGIFRFDGAEVIKVSDKIESDLLDTISFANRQYAKGYFFRTSYYLSMHDGTANNYQWVYDTRNEAWSRWTNGFHGAATRDGIMYVVGALDEDNNLDIGIYKWLDTEADNGTAYNVRAITGWLSPQGDFSAMRFRIRYIDVVAKEGAGTLNVKLYEDFKTSTSTTGTVDLDNNNFDHVYRRVHFVPALQSGRTTFQLEFQMDSATNRFDISGVDVMVSPRKRQRGGNI